MYSLSGHYGRPNVQSQKKQLPPLNRVLPIRSRLFERKIMTQRQQQYFQPRSRLAAPRLAGVLPISPREATSDQSADEKHIDLSTWVAAKQQQIQTAESRWVCHPYAGTDSGSSEPCSPASPLSPVAWFAPSASGDEVSPASSPYRAPKVHANKVLTCASSSELRSHQVSWSRGRLTSNRRPTHLLPAIL